MEETRINRKVLKNKIVKSHLKRAEKEKFEVVNTVLLVLSVLFFLYFDSNIKYFGLLSSMIIGLRFQFEGVPLIFDSHRENMSNLFKEDCIGNCKYCEEDKKLKR